MTRSINRSRQGDLGEASAIEWLTSMGAIVFLPFGHSPDFDLVAAVQGRLMRIQVKTSTQQVASDDRGLRCAVALATRGGNQSWSGRTKKIDPTRFDYLFVLIGNGRRWFIPSMELDGQSGITVGGPKYSEYEIESGRAIDRLVYDEGPSIESSLVAGEYPSGQRMATVNRPAQPSQVRILPPPFRSRTPFPPTKYERSLGREGQAVINQKRRVTLPVASCRGAGLQDGDRLLVKSSGDGIVTLMRIDPPPSATVDSS